MRVQISPTYPAGANASGRPYQAEAHSLDIGLDTVPDNTWTKLLDAPPSYPMFVARLDILQRVPQFANGDIQVAIIDPGQPDNVKIVHNLIYCYITATPETIKQPLSWRALAPDRPLYVHNGLQIAVLWRGDGTFNGNRYLIDYYK